ncbi:MAG: methyl-accepting chemotaxis protein [Desulfovibrio sp.]|nr:methyl-accepting chemotaxis protein [Desulfovibrio sp.]
MNKEVKHLGETVHSTAAVKVFQDVDASYGRIVVGINHTREQYAEVRELLDRISGLLDSSRKLCNEFNVEVTRQALAIEKATQGANVRVQRFLLTFCVGSVLLGVLCAVVIVLGLLRTLSKVSVFAGEIAAGNFEADLAVRERGEIGQMVAGLKTIPDVLNRILGEYGSLADRVSRGALDARGSEKDFRGGFATLVKGTNRIIDSFRTIVDNIPSPVMMMDGDRKVRYLNRVGQQHFGSEYDGKVCGQLFTRDDDGTPGDALAAAFQSKKTATAETVAHPRSGDMDIRYTAIPMMDANGGILSVLQLLTDQTAIKGQQRMMQEVAKDAGEISDRVAAASEELAAQVEQISKGAEVQRSRVEGTASAMTQMNTTVLEVAGNASMASKQSELSREKATEGAQLVNQVVDAINDVNQVSLALQGNMEELGKQAEAIGGVMGVISDIADQTNLLALNAAIEAARAGEAGRGFAVVADEVRKLAEKTMSATQEVGSNIRAIQQAARANVDAMGNAVKSVTDATELANRSGEALNEIVEMASANSSVVTSIATAAEEQSATSEEINKSLEEINRIVAETSDGMVQSSSAVRDLSRTAAELRKVMEGLR